MWQQKNLRTGIPWLKEEEKYPFYEGASHLEISKYYSTIMKKK